MRAQGKLQHAEEQHVQTKVPWGVLGAAVPRKLREDPAHAWPPRQHIAVGPQGPDIWKGQQRSCRGDLGEITEQMEGAGVLWCSAQQKPS
jgi:hypothetical protein